jgi:1-acyl-sn-glycerol-3-phosphate acyltransferase
MVKLAHLLKTVAEYLALYLGIGFLGVWLLLATLVLVLRLPVNPRPRHRQIARATIAGTFRSYLNVLEFLGILNADLSELDRLRGQGKLVVAPNHPSLLDAVLVISRMPNTTCIMKASLTNNVFLGRGAGLAGYILNDTARTMVKSAVERLNEGGHLLIFPEGTRTTQQPVNLHLTGAFALMAKRAAAPIQIVIIESNSPYLGKGWPLWRKPEFPLQYRVRLGPRIEPIGTTDEIVARTRTIFEHEIADPKPVARPGFQATNRPIDA